MIAEARDNAVNPAVAVALDKVVEMLQSTDIFAPHIQQVKEEDDPLTNDLVGGLCDVSKVIAILF